MTDILNDFRSEIRDLMRRIGVLESASPLGWSSISEGSLEIRSAEGLIVVGTARVDGILDGSGELDWTGDVYLRGPTRVQGNLSVSQIATISGPTTISGSLSVSGTTELDGDVTLNNDLTLGSGRIVAGPVVIDKAGSYGGRVWASNILVLDAGNGVLIDNDTDIRGILVTDGLDVDGPKNFRISHPTKPGYWLRHGSTESPVSGTEYTGTVTLDGSGKAVVELPEYFEALNKPEGRTVHLTAVGRPFPVGADPVLDGMFTVYGDPGRDVCWLVKAERDGGDFLLEEEIPAHDEPEE